MAARPESDVSSAVGLVGLAGLIAWLLICRNWPAIADALALPGPRLPLAGPYAALCTLVVTGGLMSAWSVLVDKVHRRASTGLDWSAPRSLSAASDTATTKLAGLWATWAIIGFFYCVARWYWDGQYLFAMQVLGTAAIPLFFLSVPYVLWIDRFMVDPRDGSWHFGAMLIGREPFDRDRVFGHWRAWIIKGFFGAFMLSILPGGFQAVVTADYAAALGNPVDFGWRLIELLFLIDVQIGTVGYLVTFRPLDAHIRSGNPFLAGWVAALICYPPLGAGIMFPGGAFDYHVNTADWGIWLEGQTALAWVWAAWLMFLTAIYAWATVAFGLRFSNLTYRGVLTNGPYRFTRHPAYLSKNLFWWCSTMPFFVGSGSYVDIVRNCFFLGVTNAIYYWRARTEEAHLLGEDPKYRAYHAWMAEHGAITSRIERILRAVRSLRPHAFAPAGR